MRSLVLFNNKGGVGKTTLTYNLAHIFAEQGRRVLLVDCDPQCNLTALALDEDTLLGILWAPSEQATIAACVEPVRLGRGEINAPRCLQIADGVSLLPGEVSLSRFESKLARAWPDVFSRADADAALHVVMAITRVIEAAAATTQADLVLIDVGPSLGALNRSVMLAADGVLIPLAPDLFSLRGLENGGDALREWHEEWARAREGFARWKISAPAHQGRAIGYVIQQQPMRADRPVGASRRWLDLIPATFGAHVLGEDRGATSIDDDPSCLGILRHYASLTPLAQDAHKPIFALTHADGVSGSALQSVARARADFVRLADKLAAVADTLESSS